MPAWPDREVGETAGRQDTIVTRRQLLGLGIRPRTLGWALARGRLHRVHHGVYSLIPASARPPRAAERAALLACGSRAVLSHRSAAQLLGLQLPGRPAAVEVTIVGGDRRRPGLIIHRTSSLARGERWTVGGLPVTSIARTVVDLSPTLTLRGLEHLVDQALRRTSRAKLREAAARHRSRSGVARVAGLLDPTRPSTDTWSKAEEALRRLIARAELPAPESNVSIGVYVPDMLWRQQRVIVEYDSEEFHSGPVAQRWDSVRHNTLTAQGYNVIHLTADDILEHPERTLTLIATALAAAARAGR